MSWCFFDLAICCDLLMPRCSGNVTMHAEAAWNAYVDLHPDGALSCPVC